MTNSLNTLREEIIVWSRLGRRQSAVESGTVHPTARLGSEQSGGR